MRCERGILLTRTATSSVRWGQPPSFPRSICTYAKTSRLCPFPPMLFCAPLIYAKTCNPRGFAVNLLCVNPPRYGCFCPRAFMMKGFPCFSWSLFDDEHTLIRCPSKGSPLSSGAIRRLARAPAPSLQSAPRLSTACGFTQTSASRRSAAASRRPAPFRHGSRRPASTTIGSGDSTTANTTASGPAAKRVLYSGHQPTSPLQRTAMAGWATVTALMDPERADMVATLGEVTGRPALERLYRCGERRKENVEINNILSPQACLPFGALPYCIAVRFSCDSALITTRLDTFRLGRAPSSSFLPSSPYRQMPRVKQVLHAA